MFNSIHFLTSSSQGHRIIKFSKNIVIGVSVWKKWIYYYLDVTPVINVKQAVGLNNNSLSNSFTPIQSYWSNLPINEFYVSKQNLQQFFTCHNIHVYSKSIIRRLSYANPFRFKCKLTDEIFKNAYVVGNQYPKYLVYFLGKFIINQDLAAVCKPLVNVINLKFSWMFI